MDEKDFLLPDEIIMSKIYLIRNQKVMLDRDLAIIYQVKPTRLREQVKRNIEKFPQHFIFQLDQAEVEFMVSQNAIPSKQHLGGSLPYVFTEHGVLQLANVLKSKQANRMSIRIIEVFVNMRRMLLDTTALNLELEVIKKHMQSQDKSIEEIFTYLDELIKEHESPLPRKRIGFRLPEGK